MQRFAAPEQDPSSLDSLVQSASAASDVFMLGALTYEMLVGKHAFPAKDDGIGRARQWQVLQSLSICSLQCNAELWQFRWSSSAVLPK